MKPDPRFVRRRVAAFAQRLERLARVNPTAAEELGDWVSLFAAVVGDKATTAALHAAFKARMKETNVHRFVRRAHAADRAAAEALYRTMRTPELETLREAFRLDRRAAELRADSSALAFVDGRLAIIDEILGSRS